MDDGCCDASTQHPYPLLNCQIRGMPHLDLSNIKFIQTICQIRLQSDAASLMPYCQSQTLHVSLIYEAAPLQGFISRPGTHPRPDTVEPEASRAGWAPAVTNVSILPVMIHAFTSRAVTLMTIFVLISSHLGGLSQNFECSAAHRTSQGAMQRINSS